MSSKAEKTEKANPQIGPLKTKSHLVLVGLMGAGKTTIGRRLATLFSLPFIDSDQEIVEAAGCSVSDIFEIYGEEVFRDLEKRVMSRLLDGKQAIIATGGGVYINPDIRREVQEKAVSFWLKADLDVLLERVSRRDTRPLLKKGDKKAIMGKLMDERYPIYAQADITINSNEESHEGVIDLVVNELKSRELL